jgi:hypothetical protein
MEAPVFLSGLCGRMAVGRLQMAVQGAYYYLNRPTTNGHRLETEHNDSPYNLITIFCVLLLEIGIYVIALPFLVGLYNMCEI